MADGTPTLSELSWQITQLGKQIDGFGQSLRELVRKDVYDSDQRARDADVKRLEAEVQRLKDENEAREAVQEQERGEWKRAKWSGWMAAGAAAVAGILGPIIVAVVLK